MKKILLCNILILTSFVGMAQIKIGKFGLQYCIVFSRNNHSQVDTIKDTADSITNTTTNLSVYPLTFHYQNQALAFKNKYLRTYTDCINYNEKIISRYKKFHYQLYPNSPIETNKKEDIDDAKLKLTQYILSCESTYYSILKETDYQERRHLANVGTEYFNGAVLAWGTLKINKKITPELASSIKSILMVFQKIFEEKQYDQNKMFPLALKFSDGELIKHILPELWVRGN